MFTIDENRVSDACAQTYGQTLIVAPIAPTTAVKLCMGHASQTRSDIGNDGGFPL